MAKKIIYLDNAAATPICMEAKNEMLKFLDSNYGNPSSLHTLGVAAKNSIENARKSMASDIGCQPDSVIFTSSGTEANNLAIFGLRKAFEEGRRHIITLATEHSSVLKPLKKLANEGFLIHFAMIDKNGLVDINFIEKLITPETALISIMYANNEIGTIQPISDIGRMILRYRKNNNSIYPYFHTDACQAEATLPLDVEKLHVDLMSLNGSKVYGPKGIGALYVRRGIELEPIIFGGGQENGLRSGTENGPAIVGFAAALKKAQKTKEKEKTKQQKLTNYFYQKLLKIFPGVVLNGPEVGEKRLSNNINVSFPNIEGEKLVIYLDSFGIKCSTASACAAKDSKPSHVLEAIGKTQKENINSVRFSIGSGTKKSDLDYTIKSLKEIISIATH